MNATRKDSEQDTQLSGEQKDTCTVYETRVSGWKDVTSGKKVQETEKCSEKMLRR